MPQSVDSRIEMFASAREHRPDLDWTRTEFARIVGNLRASPSGAAILAAFDRLVAKYKEPTCPWQAVRHYHTFDHVLDLLGWWRLNLFASLPQERETAFLAILYHDCVYRTDGTTHNEAASAAFAVSELFPLGLDHHLVAMVAQEILTTEHSQNRNSGYFVRDYDLVGLARDWEEVAKDDIKIRQEFANVPDEKFYEGRKKFFAGFALRPIFESSIFQRTFSDQTRQNIDRILAICDHEIARAKDR